MNRSASMVFNKCFAPKTSLSTVYPLQNNNRHDHQIYKSINNKNNHSNTGGIQNNYSNLNNLVSQNNFNKKKNKKKSVKSSKSKNSGNKTVHNQKTKNPVHSNKSSCKQLLCIPRKKNSLPCSHTHANKKQHDDLHGLSRDQLRTLSSKVSSLNLKTPTQFNSHPYNRNKGVNAELILKEMQRNIKQLQDIYHSSHNTDRNCNSHNAQYTNSLQYYGSMNNINQNQEQGCIDNRYESCINSNSNFNNFEKKIAQQNANGNKQYSKLKKKSSPKNSNKNIDKLIKNKQKQKVAVVTAINSKPKTSTATTNMLRDKFIKRVTQNTKIGATKISPMQSVTTKIGPTQSMNRHINQHMIDKKNSIQTKKKKSGQHRSGYNNIIAQSYVSTVACNIDMIHPKKSGNTSKNKIYQSQKQQQQQQKTTATSGIQRVKNNSIKTCTKTDIMYSKTPLNRSNASNSNNNSNCKNSNSNCNKQVQPYNNKQVHSKHNSTTSTKTKTNSNSKLAHSRAEATQFQQCSCQQSCCPNKQHCNNHALDIDGQVDRSADFMMNMPQIHVSVFNGNLPIIQVQDSKQQVSSMLYSAAKCQHVSSSSPSSQFAQNSAQTQNRQNSAQTQNRQESKQTKIGQQQYDSNSNTIQHAHSCVNSDHIDDSLDGCQIAKITDNLDSYQLVSIQL